ncbi:MAG: START-like domain-containing protein [Flavobacteriales bacterium]|nr:START-like domain-containing protein [Flavobacteriales bacterium]
MAKEKFETEFYIRTSDSVLFNCMITPSGLEGWFADKVNIKGDVFTFLWEGEERSARLDSKKKDQWVKYVWLDDPAEATYMEMRIRIDDMTNDLALVITDFAEPADVKDAKMILETAVDELKRILGS